MPSLNDKNTNLIFWSNPYQKTFEANVTEISSLGLVLNKTAFYPAGGGQLSDQGIIKLSREEKIQFQVTSVEKINGKIYHKLDFNENPIEIGDKIIGVINWERRYNLMKAHTSQHILSAIIVSKTKIQTSKALIEESNVTIYLEKEITQEDLINAIKETNEIFTRSLPITTKIIPRRDISKNQLVHLRGHIDEIDADDVRIVSIEGVDDSLCGGTHCKNTSEIGVISVIDFKGDNFSYIFGDSALQQIAEIDMELIFLAKTLASKKEEITNRVKKILQDYTEMKNANIELQKEAAKQKMIEVKQNAITIEKYTILKGNFQYIEKKFVLQALGPLPKDFLALFIINGPILLVSSSASSLHANKLISLFNEKTGNRGGGSPTIAQTSIIKQEESIEFMLKLIKKIIKENG
ncbi:MAG: alanyl-tRNA editing protein [Candidatus Thorarchaeota archaeon]